MSLFQDFLSLSDLVGSVACHIPVDDPKADVNADSLWQEKDPAIFEARRDAAWKKEQRQKSRAAALLGEKISNTSVGQKLRWFDVTLGTADPYWQSNKAREDGLVILAEMAQWEHQAQQAQARQDRLNESRWPFKSSGVAPDPTPHTTDLPVMRMRQIGFQPDELMEFLLAVKIPNTFVVPLPGASSESAATTVNAENAALSVEAASTPANGKKAFGVRKPLSAGPMPIPENREHLSTEELAAILAVNPQTIRKRYSDTGSYHGLVPQRLPNRRLLWPVEAVRQMVNGGKARARQDSRH